MPSSNSKEQQSAEKLILDSLNESKGLKLKSEKKFPLPNGYSVQVDGIDEKNKVVCEIYARIGKLKGGQPHKVASDFLKMLLVEKSLGGEWRKLFCFASEIASSYVRGNSWLAYAAEEFDIEICTILLPSKIEESIVSAQKRQKMVNVQNSSP